MISNKLSKIIVEFVEGSISEGLRGYRLSLNLDKYSYKTSVSPRDLPFLEYLEQKDKEDLSKRLAVKRGKIYDELIKKTIESYINKNINFEEILNSIDVPSEIRDEVISNYENVIKNTLLCLLLIEHIQPEKLYLNFSLNFRSKIFPTINKAVPDIFMKTPYGHIVGEIKYGIFRKEYYNVLAAYALLIEETLHIPVDYAILFHIQNNDIKIHLFKLNDRLRSDTIELIKIAHKIVIKH